MRHRNTILIATMMAAAVLSQPASATIVASATTPLNIRSGPGPQYSVIGAIPDNGQATVTGCIEASLWCQVSYNGTQGWAYSQYLDTIVSGRTLAVRERVRELPVLTYSVPPATVGAVTTLPAPRIVGEFVAPAGAPISLAPPPTVRTYVTANPVQPVYLNGEVVEGVGLPDTVVLTPVPDYEYQYAYVNGVPVLVEPQTRRVTYIYR